MGKTAHRQFRCQIQQYFEQRDLEVVCFKKGNAYVIYWADDRFPLARLRSTGRDDEVEVDCWDEERWKPAGEFGRVLPLDAALEYILEDPDDLFFEESDGGDESEIEDEDGAADAWTIQRASALGMAPEDLCSTVVLVLIIAVVTAVAGGACSGAITGLAVMVGTALVASSLIPIVEGFRWGFPNFLRAVAVPALLFAAAPGIVGSGVHRALGGGFWAAAAGMAVGVGLCFFACQRAPCGWFVGFFAGLILGSQLANLVGGQGQFAGLAFTSLLAVLTARKYATVAGFVGWGCGFFGRWALARFGERPCTRERSR